MSVGLKDKIIDLSNKIPLTNEGKTYVNGLNYISDDDEKALKTQALYGR